MALQLQIYLDLPPNSSHVHGRRTRTRTFRLGFQADDGLFASRQPATSADIRVSFTERGNGMPSSSVPVPGYSSSLRRGRRQVMNIHAGDKFMQIAEWVYRKVKDPMVEIDPVTVGKKIKADEEQVREAQVIDRDEGEPNELQEETIATVAPATFVLPQSLTGFSRLNLSTKVAGTALLLAAILLAYLGFRIKSSLLSKSKQNSGFLSATPGPAGIGQRDAGTARVVNHSPSAKERSPSQDLHEQFRYSSDGDSSDKAVTVRASVALTSSDSETIVTSVPAGSSHREKASSRGVTPLEPYKEKVEKSGSHVNISSTMSPSDTDLPLAKPFEEVVAVIGVGHAMSPAEVASSKVEAKPFEEVVAVKGLAHDRSPARVADSKTDSVEIQNALIFDKPQAAERLWPKEDISPAFEEEYVSAPPTGFAQPVEDPVPFNLDGDSAAQRADVDGLVEEVLNGAAASTSDAQLEEEKRKSYAEAIQAVVPAIAVGAGAVSTIIGVTSGLQVVGLVATASFLAREMILASSREQLFIDLSKVKDHKSFLEFLKSREILKDLPKE